MKDSRVAVIAKGLEKIGKSSANQVINFHSGSLFELYKISIFENDRVTEIAAKVMNLSDMAASEMNGLKALASNGCRVPKTYGVYAEGEYAILFMEFIPRGNNHNGKYILENLRNLYATPCEKWGWEEDNFIGSLPQKNGVFDKFADFYWNCRFEPQLKLAIEKKLLKQTHSRALETILNQFSAKWELDKYTPRLIHGDLWNGNILSSSNGSVYFIDPSIACSHHEQDLAMMNLFGSALNMLELEKFTMEMGMPEHISERIPFWQIYPLLVHVNLFGNSYTGSLDRIISRYS